MANAQGRRVSVDLTEAASKEVDRICRTTGLTTADVFRNAFTLLRIYVDGKADGNKMYIRGKGGNVLIELGITVDKSIST